MLLVLIIYVGYTDHCILSLEFRGNLRLATLLIADGGSLCRFFFQAEDGIRDIGVTGVQTCALPIFGTDGGVRTLLVLASNVAVSAPDARRVVSRLRDLDFLAVSDFFLSETAELADVVLPSAMWAEEAGTMTNLEGRVIRRRRALDPPAGVPDDLQLLATLADRLGAGDRFSGDPETVFDELRRASAGGTADYAGISYDRIDAEQGVFWPSPSATHPATPRLVAVRSAPPDGRARFVRVEHVEAHEQPDADSPSVLTTGGVLAHYQSGPQTRRSR